MKKTLRVFIVGLVFSILIIGSPQVFADSDLRIVISGKEVEFDQNLGKPFIDENNRTQVPFRAVMETSGAKVSWDPYTEFATASKNGITVGVPIWKPIIYKNGYPLFNDTYSRIIDGRTYLPIRIVLESLGYDVVWKEEVNTVEAYAKDPNFLLTKGTFPTRYDLRETGRIDAVRNQGESPHCWAFSASSAFASTLMPKEHFVFSPLHLADYSGAWQVYPEGGGTEGLAAAYYMNWTGPVLEKDYRFDGSVKKENLAGVKHLHGYKRIPNKDFNAVKKAIYEKGPVLTSIYSSEEEYKEADRTYNYQTFAQNDQRFNDYNHSTLLIGWDDNYPKENFLNKPKHDGAFIAKNSYGTDWGDKGFYYISYEDIHVGTDLLYFSDIRDGNSFDYLYGADVLGPTTWNFFNTNSAYYASVFNTGGQKEELKAVALYSMNTNVDYEVRLIKDYDGDPSQIWGTGELLVTSHIIGEGYETIEIPKPQSIKGDFVIVVHATTKDEILKIPYEQAYLGLEKVFNISDGLGYVSDGVDWYNTEGYAQSNVCLKVYTNLIE